AWATPIDVRFSPAELDFLFQDCQPTALISVSPYLEALAPELSKYKSLRHVISLSTLTRSSFLSYQELLGSSSPKPPDYTIVESDIAHLRYSSGTTGRPKAALTTHATELAGARIGAETMELTEKDVFVLPLLPPSWFLYMVAYVMYATGTAVVACSYRDA
ncbi:MAG: ATP-dependent acyl-CoA ligase, partial [Dehalococcoidia bacterium]|nr:ATP-dependent acyl-CoA ligase [Dehalococcoidia bacterium]